MSNCIPCPPCEIEVPLTCEPYGTVTTGNRVVVEDDAFCTKTLSTPEQDAVLVNDGGVKWLVPPAGKSTLQFDNGIKWVSGEGWTPVTITHFAKSGEKLSVNSSAGPLLVYLPENPNQFDEIYFADHYASWGTNNVTVDRRNSFIENLAENLILNTTWPNQIILRFEGSTWRVYAIL